VTQASLRPRDAVELVALAALWGGSFVFMRLGAGEFGPVALVALRVAGAALLLVPLLALRGQFGALRRYWRPILVVGVLNSALPFLGYAYAALSITAGLSAIFNATAPMFAALVAWAWLGDRLAWMRWLGIGVGLAGVAILAWSNAAHPAAFKSGGTGWAVLACIAASVCYGVAANVTKRHLTGVAPLAVAAGSQVGAALVVALPAWWWWPAATPSPTAWLAVAALAFVCTGIAYIMYFRLIANAGPGNAIAVTYLVPLFGALWGVLLLGEGVTAAMLGGGAVILLGTALATGMLGARNAAVGRLPESPRPDCRATR
jgi:drug/metabolite transporter (DMT)-like permease